MSVTFMNLGCFKRIDGEGSPFVTIIFNFFHVYSTCSKQQMYVNFTGVESLRTTPKFELRKKNSSSCVYLHVLQTTSHKKCHVVVVHGKEMNPEFLSGVIVAPTRTIWWYLRLLITNVLLVYRYLPHYF